jgi:hypothetical protein
MDDRQAQFLILVGDVCLYAAIADLSVSVKLADGSQRSGVPTGVSPTAGRDEVDHTGYADVIEIADQEVSLRSIVECTFCQP